VRRAFNLERIINMKTLNNISIDDVRQKVKDVEVVGDGNLFELLSKASSKTEGWMKSCKAMEIYRVGCVVQVTTQQQNPDGSYFVAEALTFVPDVKIIEDKNDGRMLVRVKP
jgi:predicted DNA-binding transcriptional regulator YafY